MVVGSQRPFDRLAGLVVVPDRSGQRQDPRQHTNDDSAMRATAVTLQIKLAFEGLVDRLDGLP